MHFPEMEQFLKEILSYIKCPFDKDAIKLELVNHILDKIVYYTEQGFDQEIAEQLSIKDMGDAKEIGQALNKQHNPILGWILSITTVLLVLIVAWDMYFFGSTIIYTLDSNFVSEIPKYDIVYRIDLDKTVKLDDTVIKVTHVVYEKNGDMNIIYENYDTTLWGPGASFGNISITDNNGNKYIPDTSSGRITGFKSYHYITVKNFSSEVDTLILSYENYNRAFTIEIPLKVGDTIE